MSKQYFKNAKLGMYLATALIGAVLLSALATTTGPITELSDGTMYYKASLAEQAKGQCFEAYSVYDKGYCYAV